MTAPHPPEPAEQIAGLAFALLLIDPQGRIVEANAPAENLFNRSRSRLVGAQLVAALAIADERVAARLHDQDMPVVARGISVDTGEGMRLANLTMSPLATHPGWRALTISLLSDGEGKSGQDGGGLRSPAILAHEIKNPLAAIGGAAQLLHRRCGAEHGELTGLIVAEVERIAGLVDRMQSLGSETRQPVAPCNLHELLHRARASFEAARPGHAPVKEEFDPSLPPVVADAEGLVQVVLNLLVNADQAMGTHEPREITLRTRFSSGLTVRGFRLGRAVRLPIELRVSDSGPGVPEAIAGEMFEPFVSARSGGQGLGLALVSKLLRDMDSRIAYRRDERAGLSHFTIHLPMAEGDAAR